MFLSQSWLYTVCYLNGAFSSERFTKNINELGVFSSKSDKSSLKSASFLTIKLTPKV